MTVEQTACILCSRNCGLRVEIEGARIQSVRGDDAHPVTKGYICQKAARLRYYQEHADRLEHPLRREPDGTFVRSPTSPGASSPSASATEVAPSRSTAAGARATTSGARTAGSSSRR